MESPVRLFPPPKDGVVAPHALDTFMEGATDAKGGLKPTPKRKSAGQASKDRVLQLIGSPPATNSEGKEMAAKIKKKEEIVNTLRSASDPSDVDHEVLELLNKELQSLKTRQADSSRLPPKERVTFLAGAITRVDEDMGKTERARGRLTRQLDLLIEHHKQLEEAHTHLTQAHAGAELDQEADLTADLLGNMACGKSIGDRLKPLLAGVDQDSKNSVPGHLAKILFADVAQDDDAQSATSKRESQHGDEEDWGAMLLRAGAAFSLDGLAPEDQVLAQRAMDAARRRQEKKARIMGDGTEDGIAH